MNVHLREEDAMSRYFNRPTIGRAYDDLFDGTHIVIQIIVNEERNLFDEDKIEGILQVIAGYRITRYHSTKHICFAEFNASDNAIRLVKQQLQSSIYEGATLSIATTKVNRVRNKDTNCKVCFSAKNLQVPASNRLIYYLYDLPADPQRTNKSNAYNLNRIWRKFDANITALKIVLGLDQTKVGGEKMNVDFAYHE